MQEVTFRANINVPNMNFRILIIITTVLVYVDVRTVLCCFGLCLCNFEMLKEFICSCHFWDFVAIYSNVVFARDGAFSFLS